MGGGPRLRQAGAQIRTRSGARFGKSLGVSTVVDDVLTAPPVPLVPAEPLGPASMQPGWVEEPLNIAIVSDAWLPQVNGVVRTLSCLSRELTALGHRVTMVTPQDFLTIPCPTQADIRLALATPSSIGRLLDRARPQAIHIATEGPLGIVARAYCRRRGIAFTTSFHTKFPEYLSARLGIPVGWTYALLRRFHAAASGTMVATDSVHRELAAQGFTHLKRWTRGVDLDHFRPMPKHSTDWPRPIFLSVGRVAVEKNLRAFLDLDLPGTKLVVGDGPALAELQAAYPAVRFLGRQEGEALATIYSMADVFVFSSRTDTFGLVLLEALASGLPIAAYPVAGPLDIVGDPALGVSEVGVLSEDLGAAALAALKLDPARCRARAAEFTWAHSARQFLDHLHPVA
jgi:glycosyltransferase involved in cell wall biosynthesis